MDKLRAALDGLRRLDFQSFVNRALRSEVAPAPYLDLMCAALSDLHAGKTRRVILNLPPRHLKSRLGALFAAWHLGHEPTAQVMIITCNEGLAREIADFIRTTLNQPWYKTLFPHTRIKQGRGQLLDFATTQGGGVLAAPMGASIIGRGATLLIIDDPVDLRDAGINTTDGQYRLQKRARASRSVT